MDSIFFDFVNSEFRDFRGRWVRDDLRDPRWLDAFMARWQLGVVPPPDEATFVELTRLRSLLGRIVASLTDGAPGQEDMAALNAYLQYAASTPCLSWRADAFHLDLLPGERDWNWIMAEIVLSFAHLLTHADLQRIKVCENEYCRYIFFDESKSRTKRYCTSNKCANLWKLRRFRARHRVPAHQS